MTVRVPAEAIEILDNWAEELPRSEAIYRLTQEELKQHLLENNRRPNQSSSAFRMENQLNKILFAVVLLNLTLPATAQSIKFRCEGEFNFDTTMSVADGQIVFSNFPTFRGEKATVESDVEADSFANQDPSLDGVFFIAPYSGPKYLVLDTRMQPSPLIIEIDTKTNSRRPIGTCVNK